MSPQTLRLLGARKASTPATRQKTGFETASKQTILCALAIVLVLVLGLGGRSVHAQTGPFSRGTSPKAEKLIKRANREYRSGDLKGALASVLAARRIDPFLVSTYQMEAQISYDLGDRKGYLSALHAILAANPRSSSLHNAVGKLLVQTDDFEEGLLALQRAVKLSPHKPQFAKDLAAAYVSRKNDKAAVKVLSESVKLNPQDKSLPISLARLHESSENWKQAAYYYHRAVRKDPTNHFCRRQLARCQYRLEKYRESSETYAQCLKQHQKNLVANDYIQYGDACLRVGNYKQAERIFNFVARRSSKPNKEIELLRSLCALKRGAPVEAKKIVITALKHWPEDESLKIILTQFAEEKPAKVRTADVKSVTPGKPGKSKNTSARKSYKVQRQKVRRKKLSK